MPLSGSTCSMNSNDSGALAFGVLGGHRWQVRENPQVAGAGAGPRWCRNVAGSTSARWSHVGPRGAASSVRPARAVAPATSINSAGPPVVTQRLLRVIRLGDLPPTVTQAAAQLDGSPASVPPRSRCAVQALTDV